MLTASGTSTEMFAEVAKIEEEVATPSKGKADQIQDAPSSGQVRAGPSSGTNASKVPPGLNITNSSATPPICPAPPDARTTSALPAPSSSIVSTNYKTTHDPVVESYHKSGPIPLVPHSRNLRYRLDPSPALPGSHAAYQPSFDATSWVPLIPQSLSPLDEGTIRSSPSTTPSSLRLCQLVLGIVETSSPSIETHQLPSDS